MVYLYFINLTPAKVIPTGYCIFLSTDISNLKALFPKPTYFCLLNSIQAVPFQ